LAKGGGGRFFFENRLHGVRIALLEIQVKWPRLFTLCAGLAAGETHKSFSFWLQGAQIPPRFHVFSIPVFCFVPGRFKYQITEITNRLALMMNKVTS